LEKYKNRGKKGIDENKIFESDFLSGLKKINCRKKVVFLEKMKKKSFR
jgi:hypothetical protein